MLAFVSTRENAGVVIEMVMVVSNVCFIMFLQQKKERPVHHAVDDARKI